MKHRVTREVFKNKVLYYFFPFTIPLVKCFHVSILIVWVYQNSPEDDNDGNVCKFCRVQVQESRCCLWLLMISHKFLTFSLSGLGRVCTGSPAACPRPPAAPPPPPHPPSSRPSLSSAARSRHTYTHPQSWSLNKIFISSICNSAFSKEKALVLMHLLWILYFEKFDWQH